MWSINFRFEESLHVDKDLALKLKQRLQQNIQFNVKSRFHPVLEPNLHRQEDLQYTQKAPNQNSLINVNDAAEPPKQKINHNDDVPVQIPGPGKNNGPGTISTLLNTHPYVCIIMASLKMYASAVCCE